MVRAKALLAVTLTVFVVSGFSRTYAAQPPPQPPRFQTGVEVTSMDVTVVDDHGKPVTTLTPADFNVRIDGNPRRVVSAEWISLVTPAVTAPAAPPPPDGFTSNENVSGGRLIVIAVDEPNIRFGGALGIARAAQAFIDRLSPSDRIAVASFGTGAPATAFTADRARVKQVIARMAGQKEAGRTGITVHNIALTEAIAIENGDRGAIESVQSRECLPGGGSSSYAQLELCRSEVLAEALTLARDTNREADRTIQGLRDLLTGLRMIDAPKTLILISEGFVLSDEAMIIDLGRLAAEARTSVYALRLDNQMFDIADRRAPINPIGDRRARGEGLELLAGASRGALFTVSTAEAPFFERIEAELSGYYLLGVESDPRDRDGKAHPIRVDVPQRGAIVRSRRQILNAPADARGRRSPRQSMIAALSSPLLSSALPLRVASFSLQGPEHDKVQLLIHADVGTDYPASRVVSLGYVITDQNGRVADSRTADARLQPTMNGVPSPLQYTAGASLPRGDYTLKLAIAEGDRVGTVEHAIHAGLAEVSGVTLSELMVGGPANAGNLLQPTIGYTASFGSLHGYLEAYGTQVDAVTVKYEVAADAQGPPLMTADAPGQLAGDDRIIFSHVIPIHQLPPGKYVIRALISSARKPLTTFVRAFEVSPPKVLMASAEGLGPTAVDTELFLPVEEEAMKPAFRRDQAINAATLEPFRGRVPDTVKSAFDQGIGFLTAGEYARAEQSFKKAIDPDVDSTPGLAYLAAAFAASGHDVQAASAWQTALVDGAELSQIYQWLADALMRTHDYGEARAVLEEAVEKWPSDVRFTRPLAMLYATFGKGREAVRTLERYLSEQPDDRDALYLAIEWLYHLRSAGAIVHTRTDDLKLAQTYALAYERAGGPQIALVKQWVGFLESEKR
jgi:VWFA-related protein